MSAENPSSTGTPPSENLSPNEGLLRPDQNLYDQEPFLSALQTLMVGPNAISLKKAQKGLSILAVKYRQFLLDSKIEDKSIQAYTKSLSFNIVNSSELMISNQWKILQALNTHPNWQEYVSQYLEYGRYTKEGFMTKRTEYRPALSYPSWCRTTHVTAQNAKIIGIEDVFPHQPDALAPGKSPTAKRLAQLRQAEMTKKD